MRSSGESSPKLWRLRIIAVLTKIGLVGQGCTRHRKQTPCAPSLRMLRVSVCIRPAHAKARRRGKSAQFPQGRLDGTAPVAGRERLVRHGRPRQGSTYLRTAINSQSPSARRHEAHTGLNAQSPSTRKRGVTFLGSPCVPSLILGFRTPSLPLLPSWEAA